jgi:hypothetical protein
MEKKNKIDPPMNGRSILLGQMLQQMGDLPYKCMDVLNIEADILESMDTGQIISKNFTFVESGYNDSVLEVLVVGGHFDSRTSFQRDALALTLHFRLQLLI